MHAQFTIQEAAVGDAGKIAIMVGELLTEIMNATSTQAFNFDLGESTQRLSEFIADGKYTVFVARDGHPQPAGFIALYECHALYAEGAFGTIPELYVRSEYRSYGLGTQLLDRARSLGAARGWTRLEVTTPPLPQFDATLRFYERQGFAISGGCKLKVAL